MNLHTDECGELVARLDVTPEQARRAYDLIVNAGYAWHDAHPGYVTPGALVNFDHDLNLEYGSYAYFMPDDGASIGVVFGKGESYLEVHVTPSGDECLDGVLGMSTDDWLAIRNAFRTLLGIA
jgi:hypothetical protein